MVVETMAVMVVLVIVKYLRLEDDYKVGDGGGDHGSDGGSGHCEVSLSCECLCALHTSDCVLQNQHVSEKKCRSPKFIWAPCHVHVMYTAVPHWLRPR